MTADEIVEPDDSYIYTPRGYQEEALQSIRDLYQSGANRSLVFFATGLGKSSGVMMHLPMRFPHHVRDHGFLFLAHRRKILFQAYDKFRKAYPNLWVGLEMGEHEAVGQEDAVFASVESLGREYQNRIEKYSHRHFGVIVADEGHHVQEASTWDRILNYFGVGSDEDKHYNISVQGEQVRPLSVFLTATPNRADGKTLAPFVDEVASEMSIVDGIEGGWLTDIKAHRAYKRGMDSFTEQEEIDFVVETFRKYLRDERTLVFARSVDQSRHIVHNLNEHGWAEAAHIDHKTETEDRKEIYEAFENGGIDALSNRLVLTEGYDNPAITAILDNAPTDRKALHIQKLGRGLRPHPTAKVDKYDTAEERKAAIKASEKPYLTYITTFDPTKHTLDVVAVLCETEENDEEVSIICSEVVDVLEEYDVEDEDFEISSEEDVRSINVKLQSANVFTQTIENPELQALTKLNWVVEGQSAAIRMDTTPFANTSTYRKAPCVVEFEPSGEGVFEMRIMSGGWNGTVPAKVKKHVTEVKAEDLHECIRRMDATIRDRDETLYHSLKRGSSESASQEQKDYLDRKDVAYSEPLSDETAQILINREKIKQRRQSANG